MLASSAFPTPDRERRIDNVLKLVELEQARKRQIKTYSKGMSKGLGWRRPSLMIPSC